MIDVVNFLPSGNWIGNVHKGADGFFYTGTFMTDSSVKLSYDQVEKRHCLPSTPWAGETHLHTDDETYTGSVHTDGSVLLNQTGIPSDSTVSYDENGIDPSSIVETSLLNDVSFTPSFTDQDLEPYDFGCYLGEGVEWVRRFPLNGEGFLIKIENSNTPG